MWSRTGQRLKKNKKKLGILILFCLSHSSSKQNKITCGGLRNPGANYKVASACTVFM